MTTLRHLDDQKRGYPRTVGALTRLVQRHKMQSTALDSASWTPTRELLLAAWSPSRARDLGEMLSVLSGLEQLTPGQLSLLRHRVRHG